MPDPIPGPLVKRMPGKADSLTITTLSKSLIILKPCYSILNETMLQYSKGARKVPVIVEGEKVIIGFEGKA